MVKISDKILGYVATAAKTAAVESMGYASRGCMYEPEMSEEVKAYKANHTSKMETVFDKFLK